MPDKFATEFRNHYQYFLFGEPFNSSSPTVQEKREPETQNGILSKPLSFILRTGHEREGGD